MAKKSKSSKRTSISKNNRNDLLKDYSSIMKSYLIISVVAIVLLTVLILSINIGALLWIEKLEKINCKCSEHWKRTYIKKYIYFILLLNAVSLISIIIFGIKLSKFIKENFGRVIFHLFQIGLSIASILNIIYTITYIDELKKENCICSEDIKRELYYYYNYFIVAFYIALFLTILISLFLGFIVTAGKF